MARRRTETRFTTAALLALLIDAAVDWPPTFIA
jgi:hypothetical protein